MCLRRSGVLLFPGHSGRAELAEKNVEEQISPTAPLLGTNQTRGEARAMGVAGTGAAGI